METWRHQHTQQRRVSLGTPTSPSPDLAASLAGGPFRTRSDFPLLIINATAIPVAVETTVAEANTNGSSTWAVSGRLFGCFFLAQLWALVGPLLSGKANADDLQIWMQLLHEA